MKSLLNRHLLSINQIRRHLFFKCSVGYLPNTQSIGMVFIYELGYYRYLLENKTITPSIIDKLF